jgi:sporulation protein YlmC with PRC-barrel domain
MDIPMNVDVQCSDGPGGRSCAIILDPINEKVTHFVVKERRFPHAKRLVPVDIIRESTPHRIALRCTVDQLRSAEPFVDTDFLITDNLDSVTGTDGLLYLWPYTAPESDYLTIEYEHIPPGEMAFHRGAKVEATDGYVGRIDEFLIDPTNNQITHLVLREGHLWGQRDVTIPVSEIQHMEDDIVYLKLDKGSIEQVPAIPLRRRAMH